MKITTLKERTFNNVQIKNSTAKMIFVSFGAMNGLVLLVDLLTAGDPV